MYVILRICRCFEHSEDKMSLSSFPVLNLRKVGWESLKVIIFFHLYI